MLIIITHRCCRLRRFHLRACARSTRHRAQFIINILVDDDARAGMRLARVPGGIRAGVFARGAKGA
jgi:hypothetical protein